MRDAVAQAEKPVMLYSIGKDSSVMLHLALKAFYPAKPPFPLLHVDTTWKFREMYEFRERIANEHGLEVLVHVNRQGLERGINPFTHGSAAYTDIMKTESLKQALELYGFDAAFGGARRDEERSRAKERVFSFRSAQHRWDPKSQRPELWRLYNARKRKGESVRVFPLSNWTELDVWLYIYAHQIPIVPLYLSKPRPVVKAEPPSHLVPGHCAGEGGNRQERNEASPAAANGDEQEQVDGGGEGDEDQPGDHSAAEAFGWAIRPPPRHSSPSYSTAPWPGAGAQTGSAVSTTRPSAPTRVTEHATSGARWRIRTRASNRSA